jgi:putative PIN family toxin of toxin-antitoxin system
VDEVARYHTLIFSEYILSEVDRKLRQKFGLSKELALSLISGIRQQGEIVESTLIPANTCRAPEDLPILGAAVGGKAGLLVTVDKDLLSIGPFQGIPIVRPGEFWKRTLSGEQKA